MSKGFNSKVDMKIDLEDVKEIGSELLKMSKEIEAGIKGRGIYDSRAEIDPIFEEHKLNQDMMWKEQLKDIHDREDFKTEKQFEETYKDDNKNEKKYDERDYDYER